MGLKKIVMGLSIVAFLFMGSMATAEQEYDPLFQISGIVKGTTEDSLEVYLPYINKQVTVLVSSDTVIVNRIDSEAQQSLSAINAEDLVVIKGLLRGESFCSKDISFLPSSE